MMSTMNWQEAISQLNQGNEAWVLATVIGTRGSSPREASSKMIITATHTYDTIGGGQFEFKVIEKARTLIAEDKGQNHQELAHFPLAAKTKQCCGGAVSVLLESFSQVKTQIDLFGAGHVAHALIPILSNMDVQVNWIDNRSEFFPKQSELSSNIDCLHYEEPSDHVANMNASSIALVLTHDHALDYRLTTALLDRKDTKFIGLIGSNTKALRFQRRLKSESFTSEEIEQVCCPVGLQSIPGKKPIEIAVSISAQLIQIMNTEKPQPGRSGLSWRQLNQELKDSAQSTSDGVISL